MSSPPKVESLIMEARARVIWGDPPAEVAQYLREQGIDEQRIAEVLRVCIEERDKEIRRKGVKELTVGALIFAAAAGVDIAAVSMGTGRATARLVGGCVVAGGYGVYRAVNGFIWMTSGAKVRGSVGNLGEL